MTVDDRSSFWRCGHGCCNSSIPCSARWCVGIRICGSDEKIMNSNSWDRTQDQIYLQSRLQMYDPRQSISLIFGQKTCRFCTISSGTHYHEKTQSYPQCRLIYRCYDVGYDGGSWVYLTGDTTIHRCRYM